MFDSAADVMTIVDPKDTAESAGLRYVFDARPGISRRKSGNGFTYIRADGSKLSEAAVLRRIKALAIPPAWADVWICPTPDGHIQATGRDAKGRKQYRYHPRFREVREGTKYEHVVEFADALPGNSGKGTPAYGIDRFAKGESLGNRGSSFGDYSYPSRQ